MATTALDHETLTTGLVMVEHAPRWHGWARWEIAAWTMTGPCPARAVLEVLKSGRRRRPRGAVRRAWALNRRYSEGGLPESVR